MSLKVRLKEPAANQKSVFVQSKLIRVHLESFSSGGFCYLLCSLWFQAVVHKSKVHHYHYTATEISPQAEC